MQSLYTQRARQLTPRIWTNETRARFIREMSGWGFILNTPPVIPVFGTMRRVCPTCSGTGSKLIDLKINLYCHDCFEIGTHYKKQNTRPCPHCSGTGRYTTKHGLNVPCRKCYGLGNILTGTWTWCKNSNRTLTVPHYCKCPDCGGEGSFALVDKVESMSKIIQLVGEVKCL